MEDKVKVEVIKDKLFLMISEKPPKDIPKAFYFNIDKDLTYDSYFQDFGPLDLAKIWKYSTEVEKFLSDPKHSGNIFIHHTSTDYRNNTNSALLICCFQIISLGKSPKEAWKPFQKIDFKPYRDASYEKCNYECTILDCLHGLEYAIKLGWFDFKKFNISEYEHYEQIQNGDINWIIPGKFAAFSSPSATKKDNKGNPYLVPKDYLPIFKKFNITTVIRLNTKTQDRQEFIQNGIQHHDLYFIDGSSPPKQITDKFLQITEKSDEAFAVHCKAGLGRTGTLIACYAMKHYQFHAPYLIGWIRLCRPGSILGPQQFYLNEMEKQLQHSGESSPIWKSVVENVGEEILKQQFKNLSIKNMKMSEEDKIKQREGDKEQGAKLIERKKNKKK